MSDQDDDDDVPVGGGRNRRASLANRGRTRLRTLADSSDDDDGDVFEEESPAKTKPAAVDSKDLFSSDRMKKALGAFKQCLTPTPSTADTCRAWNDVESKNFCILDLDKLLKILSDDASPTWEMKCLVVEAARQTCLLRDAKKAQPFFKKGKPHLGQTTSGIWPRDSIALLNKLKTKTNPETLQVLYLSLAMKFITDCFVIDTPKKLAVLKDKQDLDWIDLTNTVYDLARSRQLSDLLAAATSARDRWNRINDNGADGGPRSATPNDSTATPASSQLPDPVSDIAEEARKKAREERMRQMKRQGMALAGMTAQAAAPSNLTPSAAPVQTQASSSARPEIYESQQPQRLGGSALTRNRPAQPAPPSDPHDWGTDSPKEPDTPLDELERRFLNAPQRSQEWVREIQPKASSQGERLPSGDASAPIVWSTTDTERHNRRKNIQDRETSQPNQNSASGPSATIGSSDPSQPQPRSSVVGSASAFDSNRWRPSDVSSATTTARAVHDNQTDAPADTLAQPYQPTGWNKAGQDAPPRSDTANKRPYGSAQRYPHPDDASDRKRPRHEPPSQGGRGGMGMGRGRERTLPAWATANPPDNFATAQTTVDSEPGQVGEHRTSGHQAPPGHAYDSQSYGGSHNILQGNQPANGAPYQDRSIATLDRAPQQGGSGRGRGRTLPAWVTQQQEPLGSNSRELPFPQNNFPTGVPAATGIHRDQPMDLLGGRGNGRGRGRTLPAWMTQQQRDNGPGQAG